MKSLYGKAAQTAAQRTHEKLLADLVELVFICTAYHLCDKCGYTGAQAVEAWRYIMDLVSSINSDEITRTELLEPLKEEYGIKISRVVKDGSYRLAVEYDDK